MYPSPQRNEAEVVLEGASKYTNYVFEDQKPKVLYLTVKRGMDLMFALIGLVLLSPLFLIISILIKLEDPKGSVFFLSNPSR